MIYLTADVHCKIPLQWEQEKGGNELDVCREYLDILKKNKIKCTVFINGKCLIEEPQKVKKILEYDVELGGHTFDNFGKMNLFKNYFNRKRYGCVYGSNCFQEKDIKKTREIFEKRDLKMKSWRTHAFASNEETFKILAKNRVRYVSDLLNQRPFKENFEKTGESKFSNKNFAQISFGNRNYAKFSEENNITHLPINIPVDVTTISYGLYNPKNRDPFASCTKGRIEPDEWFDILKKRVINNEKNKIDSILLIHPITMKVIDNFKMFKEIAKFLSRFETKKIKEFILEKNRNYAKFSL